MKKADYTKYRIIPVTPEGEVQFIVENVLKYFGETVKLLDDYGKRYVHEVPWKKAYMVDPSFYLKRVSIGAIGRVNNCSDAALLGAGSKVACTTHHFTSKALYYVFRTARQRRRETLYIKKLEKWVSTLLDNRAGHNSFMNYCQKGFYNA